MPDAPAPSTESSLISGVAELTLEADDLPEMERFYCGVLGLGILSRDPDRVWLAVSPHLRLGLWTPGRKEFNDRGGRHVHFAFSVSPGALDTLADRLSDVPGAELQGPVEHPGGDRSIYFRDPAGNVVEAWDFLHRGEGYAQGIDALA